MSLVALADFMRLSLGKGAHAGASSAAWQESGYASVLMTNQWGRHGSPLKPKYGLNGAPKAFVAIVIFLFTRRRESAARDDNSFAVNGLKRDAVIADLFSVIAGQISRSRESDLDKTVRPSCRPVYARARGTPSSLLRLRLKPHVAPTVLALHPACVASCIIKGNDSPLETGELAPSPG